MALVAKIISQTVATARQFYEEYGDLIHKTRNGWLIVPTLVLGYFTFIDGYWPVTVALLGFVLLWIVISGIEARGEPEVEASERIEP